MSGVITLPDFNAFRPKARLAKRQTESDKPDKNPFDTSPATEAEAVHELKVRAALAGMTAALQKVRAFITAEQFMDMTNLEIEMEGELPEIDGIRHGMFLFSVSGKYMGRRVHRCLLGGDAMLISAESPATARKQALEGLLESQRHMRDYATGPAVAAELLKPSAGLSIESEVRKKPKY